MSLDFSPETLLIIFIGVAGGAFCKGVTGMGLPLIALPVMASVIELPHAIVVIMVPAVVSNGWQAVSFRAHRGAIDFMGRMILGGAVGITLGTLFLKFASRPAIVGTMGAFLIAYIAFRLLKPSFALGREQARAWSGPVFLGAGLLQGAVGIAAPAVVSFLSAMRLERPAYIQAISTVYFVFAVIQLTALAFASLLTPQTLLDGAFALAPLAIFMPLGAWFGRRVSQRAFDRLVLALLVVMAARFLAEAFAAAV